MSSEQNFVELTVRFHRRLYRSDDGSFCIAKYEDAHKEYELYTVVGSNLPEVSFPVTFAGTWVNDARYGRQFKVEWVVTQLPNKTSDIEKFIISLHVGIGPSRIKQMLKLVPVEKFWDTITDTPEKFLSIQGITETRMQKLQAAVSSLSLQRDLLEFCNGDLKLMGPRFKKLSALYKGHLDDMMPDIRENPFLIQQIGVPFQELDYFCSRNTNFCVDDNRRLTAATIQVLLDSQKQSHVCIPADQMANKLRALLSHQGALSLAACQMFLENMLNSRFVTKANGMYYLTRAYNEEQFVATTILKKLQSPVLEIDRDELFEELDVYGKARKDDKGKPAPIILHPNQKEAVYTALTNQFCVITGGPGTGKSTILDAILHCWKKYHKEDDWTLMAPTGKAAVRMTQATGQNAGTIHSTLGLGVSELPLDPDAPSFHPNKMEKGLVVVDETSMLDLSVMTALLKAVDEPNQHLVLVGDPDQLPSVGYGNVLADLISSGVVPVAKLTTIYRQAAGNPIIVNSGKMRDGDVNLDWSHNFFKGYNQGTDEANMRSACKYFIKCVNRLGIKNVAMLSPYHKKGEISTDALNALLQDAFNPDRGQPQIKSMGQVFRFGDRVMQLKNSLKFGGPVNGDVGTIQMINSDAEVDEPCMVIQFDTGTIVEYTKDELNQLELAYAISVHKSQGSQYPCVVIVLPNEHSSFLRRDLVYTGATRASKYVAFFGPLHTLQYAIANGNRDGRCTALVPLLRQT